MPVDSLVSGCVAGDRRCQRELFKRYRQRVLSLVSRSLGPGFDVDDVLQQVFIRIFRSLRGFEERSSLDTWVYRITVKVCMDQLRRKYRKRRLDIVSDTTVLEQRVEGPESADPHYAIEQRELAGKILEGLGKLTASKRMVLVLYELEGKSLEEIAEIVRKPTGTVKSRLFHARRDLQRALRKYVEE